MRYCQQSDINDCGPACLTMIASHYKYFATIGEIRELCKTDASGTNIAGLIAAAEKIGFKTAALQGAVQESALNAKLLFPFIAHVKTNIAGRLFDHYVVIGKITNHTVAVWDPNPQKGVRKVTRQDFLKMWTGYILIIAPDEHFIPEKGKGNILLKYLPLVTPQKEALVTISLASLLLIIVTPLKYG